MRDGDDIAAKKAALAKALSAAYLEHQIADLESKVNAIGVDDAAPSPGLNGSGPAAAAGASASAVATAGVVPGAAADSSVNPDGKEQSRGHHHHHHHHRDGPGAKPHHHHHHHHHHHRPHDGQAPGPAHHHHHHPLQKGGRIDDSSTSSSSSSSSDSEGEWEWRVAVVDVSALMWAPQSVRRLVQRGYEAVVPLDAIRTLDMLKKGNSPVAQAARAAARFVEHASRHWRPISSDPSIAVQAGTDYKKGRGLRLQREDESATPDAAVAGDAPPKWVTSVLGCAAFFTAISRTEEIAQGWDDEPRPAVLIAHPPLSAEVGPPPVDERPDAPQHQQPQQQNLAERAEGYTISLEAGRFELALEVLRDDEESEDVEAPRSGRGRGRGRERGHGPGGHGGHGGHGRGRGRGGGGGGGGRGGPSRKQAKEPEPVKILLRRPEPDAPRAAPPVSAIADAPASPSVSTFNRGDDERRGGGRGRGRGGRGRGRPQTDRGGGFTLLQRPGPPLAHHVRGDPHEAAPAGPSKRENGGRRDAREKAERPDKDKPDWPLRRAYASADADGAAPRVVLLQRPR